MLKLKINSDNQAFDGRPGSRQDTTRHGRPGRTLEKLQECQLPLRDLNGNTVGYYQTQTDQGKSQGAVISSPYAEWKAREQWESEYNAGT